MSCFLHFYSEIFLSKHVRSKEPFLTIPTYGVCYNSWLSFVRGFVKIRFYRFNSDFFGKGSSINDVTVLEGRDNQRFCDDSTEALVLKSVTMGVGGVKKYQILRDVIYGTPQKRK